MISDFHLHTNFSGDCDARPEVQVEKAISLGMRPLCGLICLKSASQTTMIMMW